MIGGEDHLCKSSTHKFESNCFYFQGTFSDGKEVAIKRLFLNPTQWRDLFVNEVDLINRVRHKNLVKLLGCSVDGPESMLVYEYFVNRSLDQFIFGIFIFHL